MNGGIHSIAIITKNQNKHALEFADYITDLLSKKNIQVHHIPSFEISSTNQISSFESILQDLDLIIALGGDGTTLRAFRFHPSNIPIFSINVGGNRGILSEIKLDDIENAINNITNGNYHYEERVRIQASASGKSFPPALNDIVFYRFNPTRTPTITIKFRGDKISQRMDGLVISTAIGSTGHSGSLGGPILHEDLDCLIVNPIAPIGKLPSFIIPVDNLEISSSHKLHLIVDGQDQFSIDEEVVIQIKRFPINARFIRFRKKGLRQLEKLGFI